MWIADKTYIFGDCSVSLFSAVSYFVDWIVYLLILLFALIWGATKTPRETDFSYADISIMHRYVPENKTYAPVWYLLIMIVLIPLIMIVVSCLWFLRDRNKKRLLWDIHSAVLGSFGAISSQLLLVVIIKNIAGISRPDLLNRCIPDLSNVSQIDSMITRNYCLQSNIPLLNEGFRSFPSGHSSTIYASQTFLALFLFGKVQFTCRKYFTWKLVISIIYPAITAMKIAFSRVSDNRHKVLDVILGSMIGLLFGIFFYFLYFTNPFQEKLSVAISPRKFTVGKNEHGCFHIDISTFDIDSENSDQEEKYTESIDDEMLQNQLMPNFNTFTIPAIYKNRSYSVHNRNSGL